MPPLSSRLNIRNLGNADRPPELWALSDNDTPHRTVDESRELSNDASYETSDSDHWPHKTDKPDSADAMDVDAGRASGSATPEVAPEKPDIEIDDDKAPLHRRFFCKICQQGFTRKHNMVSHELIHLTLKPHQCSQCDALFRRIHDLRRHEKLHTGEKPFHCDRCNRRFARTDALTRHLNSPNACSGLPIPVEDTDDVGSDLERVPEDPAEELPAAAAHAASPRLPKLHEVRPRLESSGTGTSSAATEMSTAKLEVSSDSTSENVDLRPPKVPERAPSAAGGLAQQEPPGNLFETINKSNYDMNRWKAFQHQQSSSKGYSYKPGPVDKNRASPSYVQRVEKKLMQGYQPGQHYHQHFHHYHHHNEERARPEGSLFSLWNLSSDREVRPDGQFSKHDDIYPRDIRGPRRDQYDQRQQEQPDAKQSPLQPQQPQAPPQHQQQHFHIPQQPQLHGPFPHFDGPQHSHYEHGMPFPKMPGMPMGHPQRHEKHDFNFQRQGWIQPDYDSSNNYSSTNSTKEEPARRPLASFVSMDRYHDLVTYTNTLQDSLSSMETRLKMLEKEADDRKEE